MESKVLSYVYFKGIQTGYKDVTVPDPGRYMKNLHRIEANGFFKYIDYAGQFTATIEGKPGIYYGYSIVANKEITKEILNLIDYDYSESFDMETNEKLDKDLGTFDDYLKEIADEIWSEVTRK